MYKKLEHFLTTKEYPMYVFLVALIGVVTNQKLPCMILLAIWMEVLLFISRDMISTTFPFLLIMMFGITYFGDLGTILRFWPILIPMVPGIIFHLVYYHKPFKPGKTFPALIAVSVAVLLGGIGKVSMEDVLSPVSFFYYIGLGPGLVLAYYIFAKDFKSHRKYADEKYDMRNELICSMFLTGILSAIYFVFPLLSNMGAIKEYGSIWEYCDKVISYRNSLSNFLVMMMPAAFYYSSKESLNPFTKVGAFLGGCFMWGALCLSMSRAALVCGTVEFAICLVYMLADKKGWGVKTIDLCLLSVAIALILVTFREDLMSLWTSKTISHPSEFVSTEEPRWKFLLQAKEDFLSSPVWGVGLVNMKNIALEATGIPDGCLLWYHSYFPQILGSMGVIGILAYGYQLVCRARVAFYKPNRKTFVFILSYLGLFLFSQCDPGEFAPIPFELLAVLLFVILERHEEKVRKYEKKPESSHSKDKKQSFREGGTAEKSSHNTVLNAPRYPKEKHSKKEDIEYLEPEIIGK